MDAVLKWARQPTTLLALAVIVSAGIYWFTGNAGLASGAAVVILGAVDDHTTSILATVERLEDLVRIPQGARPSGPPSAVTNAASKTLMMAGFALMGLGGLSACTPQDQARIETANAKVVAAGQLFCAKATATGPLVVALANMAGAPVIVTGMASNDVAAACAIIGAIPVTPPASPSTAPVVAAPVPATPLKT